MTSSIPYPKQKQKNINIKKKKKHNKDNFLTFNNPILIIHKSNK